MADKWTKQESQAEISPHTKSRWWQFLSVRMELNSRLSRCSKKGGDIYEIASSLDILPCDKAISVGCGNAGKEIDLVRKGLVKHFDLYELSEARLTKAKEMAAKFNVIDSFSFNCSDAFNKKINSESYDLVYWDNSLHHMLDVEKAVAWSYRVLKHGGGILVNDFIGASRFQWSNEELEYAARIRECFVGSKYLKDPAISDQYRNIQVKRPSKIGMWREDPSEAADSDRIEESMKKHFPSLSIYPLGGVGYHLAVNDILANFDDSKDQHLIKLLMMIDELVSELGHNHYAAMFATK